MISLNIAHSNVLHALNGPKPTMACHVPSLEEFGLQSCPQIHPVSSMDGIQGEPPFR